MSGRDALGEIKKSRLPMKRILKIQYKMKNLNYMPWKIYCTLFKRVFKLANLFGFVSFRNGIQPKLPSSLLPIVSSQSFFLMYLKHDGLSDQPNVTNFF